jgi:hypothetical protein
MKVALFRFKMRQFQTLFLLRFQHVRCLNGSTFCGETTSGVQFGVKLTLLDLL